MSESDLERENYELREELRMWWWIAHHAIERRGSERVLVRRGLEQIGALIGCYLVDPEPESPFEEDDDDE